MSMFRRRLMIQNALEGPSGGDLGYIKEGLIFHLDCEDVKDVSQPWVDRIQKVAFVLHGCTRSDTGSIVFDEGDYGIGGNVANDNPSDSTIEFVAKLRYRGVNQNVMFMPNTNNVCVGYSRDRELYLYNFKNSKLYKFEHEPRLKVVSNNINQIFCNKKELTITTSSTYLLNKDKKNSYLGCRSLTDESWFVGEIYAIRIYNRILSKEDMLHNQQVDIDRFFGGVTPQ